MKKLTLLLFVAATLLAASCSKTVDLTGTQWQAVIAENDHSFTYTLHFATDDTGTLHGLLAGPVENEDFTESFTYTFDGETAGTLTLEDQSVAFAYASDGDNPAITIVFSEAEAEELGIDQLTFHQI